MHIAVQDIFGHLLDFWTGHLQVLTFTGNIVSIPVFYLWFCGERKTVQPRGNASAQLKDEDQQQTQQQTYDIESGNQTWVTLRGG